MGIKNRNSLVFEGKRLVTVYIFFFGTKKIHKKLEEILIFKF